MKPEVAALQGPGHHLFQTTLGPLDVLGTIEGGDNYNALLSSSIDVPLGHFTVRVLSLQSIFERKRASSHAKRQAGASDTRGTSEEDAGII